MSRHFFEDIIQNSDKLVAEYDLANGESEIDEPLDIEGYGLSVWFHGGLVGWDEPLQTYFIQCVQCDQGDDLVWWLGTQYKEIPTFKSLCQTINNIFEGKVGFEFVDLIDKR